SVSNGPDHNSPPPGLPGRRDCRRSGRLNIKTGIRSVINAPYQATGPCEPRIPPALESEPLGTSQPRFIGFRLAGPRPRPSLFNGSPVRIDAPRLTSIAKPRGSAHGHRPPLLPQASIFDGD